MAVLITGASGFVGRNLAKYVSEMGEQIIGVDLTEAPSSLAQLKSYQHFCGDVNDPAFTSMIFKEFSKKIDGVIHLAGRVFEPETSSLPGETFEINVKGTLSMLEAVQDANKYGIRFLVTSSCAVYGKLNDGIKQVTEGQRLFPVTIYGSSKTSQEMLALLWHFRKIIDLVITRTFNLVGPDENPKFVTSAFMKQALAIKQGKAKPQIDVGNLDSTRDYTDIRDAVKAYWMLYKRGQSGKAYNICSGKPTKTADLLKNILSVVGIDPEIREDPERKRQSDVPYMVGDPTAALKSVNWKAEIPLEKSLNDLASSLD